MQALYSGFTTVVNYVSPAPVMIGYTDKQAPKPRIVITGEKTEAAVLEALRHYTEQQSNFISLEDLRNRCKGYDLDNDVLILLIHKHPGNCPIRGFSSFDGPLHSSKETIYNFKRRAALVIVDPRDSHRLE